MNNEEKILGMLETLTADMSEIKNHLSNIELSAADTNDRIRLVKQGTAALTIDYRSLENALRDRFINFTDKLTNIEQKVKHHDDILYAE